MRDPGKKTGVGCMCLSVCVCVCVVIVCKVIMVDYNIEGSVCLFVEMHVNVVFVMSCLYSAVSLTLVRE